MRSLLACCFTTILLSSGNAIGQQQEEIKFNAPSKKSINFFKRQVDSSRTLERAMSNLLARYPTKTADFVRVALSAYPDDYKEIIEASVQAQPMFVDEIIFVANKLNVASATEIVEIAVNAEPSYAATATQAACEYTPEQFNDIVRTAVSSEPDSADRIAQQLVRTYPNKTMEILVTTIKEVPYVGKYVLDALLAVVGEDEEASEEMIIISVEQLAAYPDAVNRLVELASQRQIEKEQLMRAALNAGIEKDQVAALIDKHYNKNDD